MQKLITKKRLATVSATGAVTLLNVAPVLAGAAAGDGDAGELGKTGTPAVVFILVGAVILVAAAALTLRRTKITG